MKKSYLLLAVMLTVLGMQGAKAQSKITMNNGANCQRTIQVSEDRKLRKLSDNMISVSPANAKRVVSEAKETHTLQIQPEGDWMQIIVYDGANYLEEFYMWDGDFYSNVIPEGVYDILVTNGFNLFYNIENLTVDADITLNPNMEDAKFGVTFHGTDENGTNLTEINAVEDTPAFTLYFVWDNLYMFCSNYGMGTSFEETVPVFYTNDYTESCLRVDANYATQDQKVYHLISPEITEVHENIDINIDGKDLYSFDSYFNLKTDNVPFFGISSFLTYAGSFMLSDVWNRNLLFNSGSPITTLTNAKVTDPVTSLDDRQVNFEVLGMVYRSHSWTSDLHDQIYSTPMAMDANGMMSWEPFDRDPLFTFTSYPPLRTATQITSKSNISDNHYFGYRAPVIFYNASSQSASSGSGSTCISGNIYPIGENGCIRFCDQDRAVSVTLNGQEIFNDSICKSVYLPVDAEGVVEMNLIDDNVFYDGINMVNQAQMTFDLSKDDIWAPTMTLLQVLDANGNENIIIEDLEGAKIRFGACDYSLNPSPWYFPYQGKPFVEAFFSIHENDFYPLSFTEDEALFDESIGHVFEIDLSQLQGIANGKWVSVGFMVTDQAGNSQIQVLSPLFFAGSYTAVGEDTATTSNVYPNPFQTSFTVNAVNPVSGKAVVNVYNVLGENVYTKAMNCNETTEFVINGSSLNAGIYFYSIATENGTLQGRIVKE